MLSTAPNQAVKLLDFGISKVTKDPRLTTPGAAMGTPDYMAPEQTMDALGVTAASDLYALGVIAFELLSGRLPFISNNVAEMMFKVLKEPPPKLASVVGEIDPRLSDLVDALLTKDPKARPQTAAGVRAALLSAVKPDAAALWKLVKSPDDVGFAPTFARPSPATPLQLAELARTMPEDERVPSPELPPGVPHRSGRKTAVAPERVVPMSPPVKRSALPLVVAAAVAVAGAGGWYGLRSSAEVGVRSSEQTAPVIVATPTPPPPEVTKPPEPEPTPPPPEPVVAVPEPTPEPAPNIPPAEPAKSLKSPTRRVSNQPSSAPSKVQILIAQGHAAMKANDYDLAKKKFTECTRTYDEEADCFAGLAQVLTTLGDSAAADRANKRAANLRR